MSTPKKGKEIERKFLLPHLDVSCIAAKVSDIEQYYIKVDVKSEVRLRHVKNRAPQTIHMFFMTIKGSGDLVRPEVETQTDRDYYTFLLQAKEGNLIEKVRYQINYDNLTLEVDEYKGKLLGLVILEVEFESEEQAAAFELPDWAQGAIEVTNDKRFKNKNLAFAETPPTL
jgi:adenylate cyclase